MASPVTVLVALGAEEAAAPPLLFAPATAGAAGSAGSRALKLSTATVPATVAVRTMGARRIGLEGEGLVVDLVLGDAGLPRGVEDEVGEAAGTADVDVALLEVGHEAPQRGGVERDLLAGADELVQP